MEQNEIMLLGLGLHPPWELVGQQLNLDRSLHELQLEVGTERGTRSKCPQHDKVHAAHDYQTRRCRHLNFFEHHCYITDTDSVPRVNCPDHGVLLVTAPWGAAIVSSRCCSNRW